MFDSHLLLNPMIEGQASDTLSRCAESLAYLSETVALLQQQDASPQAFQGMQVLLDCIQQALLYEQERLEGPGVSRSEKGKGSEH